MTESTEPASTPRIAIGNRDVSLKVLVFDHGTASSLELWDVLTDTLLYVVWIEPIPGRAETRQIADRMMYPQRASYARRIDDSRALEQIASLVRQPQLSEADFVQDVAGIIEATGRDITTPGDPELWET